MIYLRPSDTRDAINTRDIIDIIDTRDINHIKILMI